MSKIKANLLYQSVYQILIIVLPIVTAPYVSRVLGAENIGYYSYSFSVVNYFVLFAMLGINNYGNKHIAEVKHDKDKLNKAFTNLFILHCIVTMVTMVVYLLYAQVTSDNRIYAIICFLYLVGAFFDINWLFFGLEEFKITVIRNTLFKLGTVCAVFIFVRNNTDTWKYILIMALGNVISQSIVWYIRPRYVKFVKPEWKLIKSHIKPLIILFIPVIAVSVYKIMDKIMIEKLSDTVQVGYYENAEKIINVPMGLITAVGVVMLPRAASLVSDKKDSVLKQSINVTTKYVMILAYALAFGLIAIGADFTPLFFGHEFIPSGLMIQGLAITIPFMAFANIIRTQYLIPKEYNRIYIASIVSGAIINFIVNFFLIQVLRANGAVIGTILAEIVVCTIQAFAVRKELDIYGSLKESAAYLVVAFLMYCCVRITAEILPLNFSTLVIEIIVGVITYVLLCFLVMLKRQEALVKKVLRELKKRNI